MNIHEVAPQTVIVDRGRHWVIRIYSIFYEGEKIVFVKVNRFSEIDSHSADMFEADLQWLKIVGVALLPVMVPIFFVYNYSVLGIVPMGRLAAASYGETGVVMGTVTLTPACFGKLCDKAPNFYGGRSIVIQTSGKTYY